jgi:hypothetical protein
LSSFEAAKIPNQLELYVGVAGILGAKSRYWYLLRDDPAV